MLIDNMKIIVNGKFPKIARLEAEYYDWLEDPYSFIANVKQKDVKADLFTFLQRVDNRKPHYNFHLEWDKIAVLPISTYETWWKKQINSKTRNMIRKAQKKGVEVRLVEFNDSLINGIKDIYDESPLRQGKPFKHYRKDLDALRNAHITFAERSQFIGAFYQDELIGFIKLVHDKCISHFMQIISKISHRNKAPTNALIAKAVEICAQRGIPYLHYGVWSSQSLGDFKIHNAFEPFELPRYFVPLNSKGKLILKLRLHQNISKNLPGVWINFFLSMRTKWYRFRYGRRI